MAVPFRIDERYDIVELLGEGGMGIVYKAYDSHRNGYVALKTMKDAADPGSLELFAQEWRTLANLCHPNIVDVFNSGEYEENGQRKPYFVMPLLPGKTLYSLIRESGHHLTTERIVEIMLQTCRGLQAAHDQGLIHRDLKPSNLFVMSDDSVKIIDFGMVHLVDLRKTKSGLKGTLQYMAPEQIEMKEVTPATDIFALGVVCYEALTGRKPFDRPTESAIAHAIRSEFPPPASELNPAVNKTLSQVVAKAMAKGPWNRFASPREFGEYLQKASRGDPIDLFDGSKIQPRMERARRALSEGDLEFASEILNDLQLEGRVDPEILLLLDQVKQAMRSKEIRQLLASARMRMQEEEFPLAWQKVQEALQLDPGNTEAQSLQAEIETRRSDQQIEKWRRLVQQHLHNVAFSQARQAIEEIRKIKRDDPEVAELMAQTERRESEFRKACEAKEQQYQSAMRAYGSGEISTALSKLEKVLELDGRTPGFINPGRDEVYRETYNRIRTEWEAVQRVTAEIERVIASGNLARAAELSSQEAEKYPNDFGLQALKLKVDDLLRQEKSAYMAEVVRRVEAEPNLEVAVKLLEEALEKYPNEPHFQELAASLRKRRDLVDSIVLKARQCEEQNLLLEALGQWNTLRNIYPQYPGLDFEVRRVLARIEQQKREEAKLTWVSRIDRLLQTGEFQRAHSLALEALAEFPGDQELETLSQVALNGQSRSAEASQLMERGRGLCSAGQIDDGISLLRQAAGADPHSSTIRDSLADALAVQGQALMAHDWRAADPLIQEALRIAPEHALAKSLRPSLLLAKRSEFVERCVMEARELQATGDRRGALSKVQEGLREYPTDVRLLQLQKALRSSGRETPVPDRDRALERVRELSRKAAEVSDQTSLEDLLQRTIVLSTPYGDDPDFTKEIDGIRGRTHVESRSEPPAEVEPPAPAIPAPPPPAEPRPRLVDQIALSARQWRQRALRSTSALSARILQHGRSQGLAGSIKKQLGGLSWTQWGILAAILLIGAGTVYRLRHRPPPPKPPARAVRVSFSTNIAGARILVDGQTIEGDAKDFLPGQQHSAIGIKPGYTCEKSTFDSTTKTVALNLKPAPHAVRISAEGAAKVWVDDQELGALTEGTFAGELPDGEHTLRLKAGKEIFSMKFHAEDGAAIRLLEAPKTADVPVMVVSTLGSQAWVQSSLSNMKVATTDGSPQPLPADGATLTLTPTSSEITFDDGKKPRGVPVEISDSPMLTIVAGSANKGTLVIQALEGAQIFLSGVRKPITIPRSGKWMRQLEPGDYTVRLQLDGYDPLPEQHVTITAGKNAPLEFHLTKTVSVAYLRIDGGIPGAEVLVDGNLKGTLDSSGSLAPIDVAPDVVHVIKIQKENYESFEGQRSASAKQMIQLGPAEARLRALGTLVFDIQTPGATVTIQGQNEATPHDVTTKSLHLRAGTYVVRAEAAGYDPLQTEIPLTPGESRNVLVALKATPVFKPPTSKVEIPDLFYGTKRPWTRQGDFWVNDGIFWFKGDIYLSHTFDVLKPKSSVFKHGKVQWRISLQASGDDYIEYQLDDSGFSRKDVIDGKTTTYAKRPYKSEGNFIRMEMTIASDHVTIRIGDMVDTFTGKVEGRSGFYGKFGLRLVK